MHYKKEQSHFFNAVSRNNYFLAKNKKLSTQVTGPSCTRYKPKYELVDMKPRCADVNQKHQGPTHIEEIILRCYKKFQ